MFWEAFVFLSKTLNKTDTTSIQKRAFIIYTQKTSKIDKNYPLPLHDIKTMLHELKPQTPIKPHNRLPIYLTSNSNKYPRYNTATKEKLIKGNPQINYLLLAKDGIEKCFMNLFFCFSFLNTFQDMVFRSYVGISTNITDNSAMNLPCPCFYSRKEEK